jgi:hypothetical protein
MYKEEKIINGILHYRTSPNAEFKPYTLENLTGIVGMLKEEMQKQEQGNIEGKDPITIEGKDPINIDCTSMIYNPKDWGATLGVDSSRINLGYESMQGTLLGKTISKKDADKDSFEDVTKYKKERIYSEEELIELLQKALTHKDDGETGSLVTAQGQIRTANFFSWFEQFKNNRK